MLFNLLRFLKLREVFPLFFDGIAMREGEIIHSLQVFFLIVLLLCINFVIDKLLILIKKLKLLSKLISMSKHLIMLQLLFEIPQLLSFIHNIINFSRDLIMLLLLHLVANKLKKLMLIIFLKLVLFSQSGPHASLNVGIQMRVLFRRSCWFFVWHWVSHALRHSWMLLIKGL